VFTFAVFFCVGFRFCVDMQRSRVCYMHCPSHMIPGCFSFLVRMLGVVVVRSVQGDVFPVCSGGGVAMWSVHAKCSRGNVNVYRSVRDLLTNRVLMSVQEDSKKAW
jgi:hypothetical protein